MLEAAVTRSTAMADHRSLRLIGYTLSGVAAVVIGVGIIVVQAHLSGTYVVDDPLPPLLSNSLPIIGR
jgi:hypothetical protein